jgi:hypothetical protein
MVRGGRAARCDRCHIGRAGPASTALVRPPDHQDENGDRARGGENVRGKRDGIAQQGHNRGIETRIGGLAFGKQPRAFRLAASDRAERVKSAHAPSSSPPPSRSTAPTKR